MDNVQERFANCCQPFLPILFAHNSLVHCSDQSFRPFLALNFNLAALSKVSLPTQPITVIRMTIPINRQFPVIDIIPRSCWYTPTLLTSMLQQPLHQHHQICPCSIRAVLQVCAETAIAPVLVSRAGETSDLASVVIVCCVGHRGVDVLREAVETVGCFGFVDGAFARTAAVYPERGDQERES